MYTTSVYVPFATFTPPICIRCIAPQIYRTLLSQVPICPCTLCACIGIPWVMGASSLRFCWLATARHVFPLLRQNLESRATCPATILRMCWSYYLSPIAPPRYNHLMPVASGRPRPIIASGTRARFWINYVIWEMAHHRRFVVRWGMPKFRQVRCIHECIWRYDYFL